jgi:hypothetical protein
MIRGISGSFQLAAENDGSFAAEIPYYEEYDESTGKHVLTFDAIKIQSSTWGKTWYPHGSIAVDGAVVGTMDNSNPASHSVSLTAGSGWHTVTRTYEGVVNGFKAFPWKSEEITSEPDGTKTVTVVVDFLLYRDSNAPRPSFKGTFSLELTPTARHYTLSISEGVGADAVVTKNGDELEDGATITHGDELMISFSAAEGYKITEQSVNGNHYQSGEKHTVTGDVSVHVKARVLAYAIGSGLYHAHIGAAEGAKKYVAYVGDENNKPVLYGQ